MSHPFDRLHAALAGRYTVTGELGRGGVATVYLAEDLRHRRKVAVKVLRPDLAATLGPERFAREIEIAAQLQHPHILPVLDSGEAGGFLFYVMPYVGGESLREKVKRQGQLPITEAVRLLSEIADALAYAHAHGVVHRDVKPDNVLLSGRHVLVADFGVAKALSQAAGTGTALATAGIAVGTPAYMAPEQATADPDVDHRADIYALGVVGYEMLAGRPPFTGTSRAIIAAHTLEEPPPSRRPPARAPSGVGRGDRVLPEEGSRGSLSERAGDRGPAGDHLPGRVREAAQDRAGQGARHRRGGQWHPIGCRLSCARYRAASRLWLRPATIWRRSASRNGHPTGHRCSTSRATACTWSPPWVAFPGWSGRE